jgi:mRNA interferase MazF
MICERWDVVVASFPFTDLPLSKGRPAVVLSDPTFQRGTGQAILAMITSGGHARWPTDVDITDLKSAGLRSASLVRLKMMTLVNGRISRRIGRLADDDKATLIGQLRSILP